uniref:EF-hand domain-containing protein n=1 Tax=Cannabis sativa TaxID=3483 RepID=A0A803R3V3_CANSA
MNKLKKIAIRVSIYQSTKLYNYSSLRCVHKVNHSLNYYWLAFLFPFIFIAKHKHVLQLRYDYYTTIHVHREKMYILIMFRVFYSLVHDLQLLSIDVDNSGQITLEELKNGLEKVDANLKDSEISGLMQAVSNDSE